MLARSWTRCWRPLFRSGAIWDGEIIVTADHGQDDRGHHGGKGDLQQLTALYYFGEGQGPHQDAEIDQLQIAPTILSRLGADIPASMTGHVFLK